MQRYREQISGCRGMEWGQMKWAEGVRGYKLASYKINKS